MFYVEWGRKESKSYFQVAISLRNADGFWDEIVLATPDKSAAMLLAKAMNAAFPGGNDAAEAL
jgi:hypothetical protein